MATTTTHHPNSDDSSDDSIRRPFKNRRIERQRSSLPTNIVSKRDPTSSSFKRRKTDDFISSIKEASNDGLSVDLKKKKEALDKAKQRLENGEGGIDGVFRVPPGFDQVEFSDDERMAELESRPSFDPVTNPPCNPYVDIELEESLGVIPCSIAQYLRSYQIDGAKFLHKNFVFQEGCILGDDMGLGKTIQVIAFLTAAFGKTGDERDRKRMRKIRQLKRQKGKDVWYPKVLIICPSSLIKNWENELRTWGWWTVYVFHGSKDEKEYALQAAKKGSLEIMITNYDTYRMRHSEVNTIFWDCVIADECHKIKERSSETTQRMNEINSLCRIGLTGTAIQNNYEELWTLLNWCRPGSIGSVQEWERSVATPLRVGQRHDATLAQIGKGRKVAHMLKNNLLPRMFLRRMKTLIAHQLPKKTDKVVFCPLTDTQREAYEAYLESDEIVFIRDGSDLCDCGSGKSRRGCCHKFDPQGRSAEKLLFPAIIWVQKLSNHLANWIPDHTDSSDERARKLELLQICLPDKWRELSTRERMYNYMDPQMCGKWTVLQRLLQFWYQNGDKVLIFSYSLHLLHILHQLFKKTEYNLCYLDGTMSLADRAKAVDDFNSDPDQFVFLISTKAGGVGLNITAANKVVIFDPNWNPSWDLQAQDRAYRIGQTRDVEVFRLISAGTIEEIVYARQIYKQQQANIGYDASEERRYFTGVMGDNKNRGELFGLKNLFTFHQEETILKDIVNKTNVAERKAGVLIADLVTDETKMEDEQEEPDLLNALSQVCNDLPLSKKNPKQAGSTAINPIAAILAEAGVSYTHENSEVIGTSKVEAQISKKARESTETAGLGEKKVFDDTQTGIYRFNPPEDVRKRQFVTAAKMFGFADPREFALVVEGWTQEQRRRALERFYQMLIERGLDHYKGVGSKGKERSVSEEEKTAEERCEERSEERSERRNKVIEDGVEDSDGTL